MLPMVLTVLPSVMARLSRARNCVGAPSLLAGIEIGGINEAANAELAAGGADNGEVTHHQRRHGDGLAQRRIGDLAFPNLLAGGLVQLEHPAIERDRYDLVLPQRHAAVIDAATGDIARPGAVDARIELPFDGAPRATGDVDGIDAAPAIGDVHDAVFDQRRALEITEGIAPAALQPAQRNREDRPQVLDRLGVDGGQRRKAVALIIAVIEQPVLRLLAGIERALERHLGSA